MEVGERIRALRERRDWTQKKLAEKVGINLSVFNRIEMGERRIRDNELTKIADALGVTNDYLLGIAESENKKTVNDKETTIKLIEEQAKKMGLSVSDPAFQKMLSDAFDLLRIARGKDFK